MCFLTAKFIWNRAIACHIFLTALSIYLYHSMLSADIYCPSKFGTFTIKNSKFRLNTGILLLHVYFIRCHCRNIMNIATVIWANPNNGDIYSRQTVERKKRGFQNILLQKCTTFYSLQFCFYGLSPPYLPTKVCLISKCWKKSNFIPIKTHFCFPIFLFVWYTVW